MNPDNLGGGEILDYVGNGPNNGPPRLDESLIRLFEMIPIVKVLIFILAMLVMGYVILRIFNIKSPFRGKGIKSEISNIEEIKRRDAAVLRANKFMRWATAFIERTPLTMDRSSKEYWQYNINRAGLKIPGGSRNMRVEEFHALVQILAMVSISFSVVILLFVNSILGWVLIIFTAITSNTIPRTLVRQIVKNKDSEIKEHFSDFYLMIHYVLIASASTPLSGIMKSYARTTSSSEMHRFIDVCIHHIDTYGEFEATRYIAKDYRELHEVGKLMRLIRQANEGGDIQAELMGFRTELINAKQYAISKRVEKLVGRARASFNILMPILIQAVLSAMSIYLSDLGLAKGLLG